jgi:protein-tyrosine phosphatase
MMDATCIIPGLYQGSIPVTGDELRNRGFHTLILCAEEHQPSSVNFPGLKVVHAPNDDNGSQPTSKEMRIALQAADVVARDVAKGKNVLVTCMQGRNRSGLVTALAVSRLTGMSGRQSIRLVKHLRKNALTNPAFCQVLEQIG